MQESLRLTAGHNARYLTGKVDARLNSETELISHLSNVIDTRVYAQEHEVDIARCSHSAVEIERTVASFLELEAFEDPSADIDRARAYVCIVIRGDYPVLKRRQSRNRLECRTGSVH